MRVRLMLALAGGGAALFAAGVASAMFTGGSSAGANYGSATLAPPTGLGASQACVISPGISFRAAASAGGSNGSLTIAKPSGVIQGDVLLAQFGQRSGGATVTPPSGWTQVLTTSNGTQVQSTVFVKVAGAGEPSSYAFSSSSLVRTAGGIAAYSGVDTASPVNISGGGIGTSASPTAPSVTTTVTNTQLVAFWTMRQQAASSTPGSMSQRWNLVSGGATSSVGAAGADEGPLATGPTGSRIATTGASRNWVGQSVALKPDLITQASLSWTATTSAYAAGYKLERWAGSTLELQNTITPMTVTSATDAPLTGGTAYQYRLASFFQGWTSSQATHSFTAITC